MSKGTKPMVGFYDCDPKREYDSHDDSRIHLYEITSALEAVAIILSETIDDGRHNEGLSNCMRVLVALLRERECGENVVVKPMHSPRAPRPRKRRPAATGTVVQLVREQT